MSELRCVADGRLECHYGEEGFVWMRVCSVYASVRAPTIGGKLSADGIFMQLIDC